MSEITKKALADSLKSLMKKKPIDKITIREITEECGLSRMTFYYHFEDIYSLVEWATLQDLDYLNSRYLNSGTSVEEIKAVFRYFIENKDFFENVRYSMGREILVKHLYNLFNDYIYLRLAEYIGNKNLSDDDKKYITDVCKNIYAGAMLEWFWNNMPDDYDKLVNRLYLTVPGIIESMVSSLESD